MERDAVRGADRVHHEGDDDQLSKFPPAPYLLFRCSFTKKAKLPRIRFHDLRHSHATDLLANGEHPKVVAERLRHYDPAFTLRVYSHVLPGMQAQAALRLEERLFGEKAAK